MINAGLIVLLFPRWGRHLCLTFAKIRLTVTINASVPGNHYGHCNDQGKHKGHHKNGDYEHEMDA
jgi:hypothetical protein